MSWQLNNTHRIPDDVERGPELTPAKYRALAQKIGWGQKDLGMSEDFFAKNPGNGARVLHVVADTGLPQHVDISEDKIKFAENFTRDSSVVDENYHSTWITGSLVANNDNDLGWRSYVPEAEVGILKVLSNAGSGSNMKAAMRWFLNWWTNNKDYRSGKYLCAFYGMSYGGGGFDQEEQQLFKDMAEHRIIPNASSGNESRSAPSYPAGYEGVYKCGAYDKNRQKASFTNYGPWTDFVAPGVNVPSTVGKNKYAFWSGTSMSRPITEACLSQYVSSHPDDIWLHNYHGLQEAVRPFMENLPGSWDGDGVFLPASAITRRDYFIF
jgi:subtilisin